MVEISVDQDLILLKRTVERYLDDKSGTFRNWSLNRDVQEMEITIDPEKIYSRDYGDRMQGILE